MAELPLPTLLSPLSEPSDLAQTAAIMTQASVVSPRYLEIGAKLGRYEIKKLIGSGGMASVYLADDPLLGRTVALKTAHVPEDSEDVTVGLRFLREAEVLASLAHRNIVRIHDAGTQGETAFMVLEYMPGKTLHELLRETRPLPVQETARILVPICAALASAHSKGIVHLDLKPANIILHESSGSEEAKVLDFGVCFLDQIPQELDPGRSMRAGTPVYMAPEGLRREPLSASVDIFALGIVAIECLTGHNPFENAQSIPEILKIIDSHQFAGLDSAEIDEATRLTVLQAVDSDPARRQTNIADLGLMLLQSAPPAIARSYVDELSRLSSVFPTSD